MIRAAVRRLCRPEIVLMALASLTIAVFCVGAVLGAHRERRNLAEIVVDALEVRSEHAGK